MNSKRMGSNVWIQNVEHAVNAVTYSPDGGILYTQDNGRWFAAWEVATHTNRRLFQYPEKCSNHFPRMFTSPDGRYLISNTSPPTVWNLGTNELQGAVPGDYAFAGASTGLGRRRIECVTQDWLGIRIWHYDRWEKGDELRDWPVTGTIKTHHFSPDGRSVALLNWNDVVTICDVESRTLQHVIEMPRRSLQHCRFAPDGNTLVMYAPDSIAIWDIPTASFRVEKVECDRPYWLLAFHPTAPLIAVRRKDGLLKLVDLRNGEEVRALDFALGTQVECAAFSPDGLTCAVGGKEPRFAVFDVDL